MKIQIKKTDISEVIEACPYCGNAKENKRVCCGENHFATGYVMDSGHFYLENEVEITDEVAS